MADHSPLIAYLSEHELALYAHSDRQWRRVARYDDTQPAQDWGDTIGRRRPLSVVADLIELDLREELVPPASGIDRQALLRRRVEQTFRQTPYRGLISTRPDTVDGRKVLRLLMGALINPQRVDHWLGPLQVHGAPVRCITAVPHLVVPAAVKMQPDSTRLLVVTIEPAAGIRLTYARDGQLRFSRLGPMPERIEDLPHAVVEESVRTDQYLASLRLHEAREGALDVLVLVPPAHMALRWDDEVRSTDTLNFSIRPQALALGPRHAADLPDAQGFAPVAVRLAAADGPKHLYGDASVRQNWLLFNIRQLLFATAVAAPLLAVATASLDLWQAWQARTEAATLRQSEQQQRADYAGLRQRFPNLAVSADHVRQAVTLSRQAIEPAVDSEQVLRTLSAGFDSVPQARLQKLVWFNPQHAPTAARAAGVVIDAPDAAAPADPSAPKATPAAWVAIVEGRIDTTRGYREANELTRKVARDIQLAGDVGTAGGRKVSVEILKLPFDESPSADIRGESRGAERLPFRLRVNFAVTAKAGKS